MKLYLKHPDNMFSNAADYPDGIPFEAPAGCEWEEGIPDGLEPLRIIPFADRLNAIFESTLSPELQADLAPLKVAVKLELELGRIDIARLIILRAVISPELEPVRSQLLSLFTDP